MHCSPILHGSPVAHAVPSATSTCLQPPIGSHESVVQALLSSQSSGGPATHMPAASHVSAPLQALPSPHGKPTGAGVKLHPVTGSHPSIVHGSKSKQSTTAVVMHLPAASHASMPLQTSPSSHGVFAGRFVWMQPV